MTPREYVNYIFVNKLHISAEDKDINNCWIKDVDGWRLVNFAWYDFYGDCIYLSRRCSAEIYSKYILEIKRYWMNKL